MYERFTDRTIKVMQLANEEAHRLNHEYIGTEHLLLGLVKLGSGVADQVLKNLQIEPRKIRTEIEKIVQFGPDPVMMGKLPQTPRAKKVIEYAILEARNLKHNYVGTKHLLLGLMREQDGVAAQVLVNLGLTLEDARDEVLRLLGHSVKTRSERDKRKPDAAPKEDAWKEMNLPETAVLALGELDQQIEQLTKEKEEAVAASDFEKAAILRDKSDRLKKQKQTLIREAQRDGE
jgi:ATP-dependent Clp protease ATP-binding subunit ClpC